MKVGLSACVITPEPGENLLLGGYAARNHAAEGVHDDLFAKAICFAEGELRAILISIDVVAVMPEQFEKIRAEITARCGIVNVIVCATHDHSAPDTMGEPGKHNAAWCARMMESAVRAAEEAIADLAPAKLYGGFDHVPEVAKNRRGEETVDDELFALRIEGEDGRTRGILINYACHCTVLDANNYHITADYPGYLYQQLSAANDGAIVLFTNASCGNINIGYSADASALGADMGDVRTYENAAVKAKALADKAQAIFARREALSAALDFHRFQYEMPLKPDLPDAATLRKRIEARAEQIAAAAEEERERLQIDQVYDECLLEDIIMFSTSGKTHLTADGAMLRLGDVVLLTVPVELFCEIGLRMKEDYRPEYRLVILGYGNGLYGYLPTRAAHERGGYECETSVHDKDGECSLFDTVHRQKCLL